MDATPQMTCQIAREAFPEFLDSRTAPTARMGERSHLAACPDCQREFAALTRIATALDETPSALPSGRLRQRFYAMLEEEKHSARSIHLAAEREHHARGLSLWRWLGLPLAGCALLAAGFVGGTRFSARSPEPQGHSDPEARRQLADLQQRVNAMGQLVGYSLVQQRHSPTVDRLQGVLTSASRENPPPQVINELISALALDPSAHVRLSALDGLAAHLEQEVVRAGVLACLAREENPLVQVSMIDLLATARDASARPAIEKLSTNVATDRNVRDAARRALAQL